MISSIHVAQSACYAARIHIHILRENGAEITSVVHKFTHHPQTDQPQIWVVRTPRPGMDARRLLCSAELFGHAGGPIKFELACEFPTEPQTSSNSRVVIASEPLLIITADGAGISITTT